MYGDRGSIFYLTELLYIRNITEINLFAIEL